MHVTTLALTLLTSLLPTALAGTAYIKNNCAFPVYLNSNLNNKAVTLASKTGTYSEAINRSGAAVKLGTAPALSGPLTFEYSLSGGVTYYDLSSNAGNPFSGYRNTMVPSVASCAKADCAAGASGCYSNGNAIKVYGCQGGPDLTVTLCA